MFLFRKSKKELDITDALIKKEAQITIGGKSVVIKAFHLAQALQLIEALKLGIDVFKKADLIEFNKYLLTQMPVVLKFCLPDYKIDQEKVTLAEFADLIMAVYYVNDLERIIANFTMAVQSMQKLTQGLATSPKH